MKIIQILNIIILSTLIGLFWLADKNSEGLYQHSIDEEKFSATLKEHTQSIQSGQRKDAFQHLLSVLQNIAISSSSDSEIIQDYVSSINNMKIMILGLILLQIVISIYYYILFRSSLKQNHKTNHNFP